MEGHLKDGRKEMAAHLRGQLFVPEKFLFAVELF